MAEGSHGGRPSSWITVSVMVVGFAVGGLGLTFGPMWWLFWVGVAIAAIGGVLALAVGIFSDVVVDAPRDISAAPNPAGYPAEKPAVEAIPETDAENIASS